MKIEDINGYEIVKFLTKELKENDDLCDVSIRGDIEFVAQERYLNDRVQKYELYFSGYYNNWGTHQLMDDNYLVIDEDGVEVFLGEPFEGDGSSEAIEQVLTEWLNTHEFNANTSDDWSDIMGDVSEELSSIEFEDPKGLQDIIDKLTKAKSYMN